VELGEFRMTNKLELSAEAAAELKEMMEVANHAVNKALVALEHKDKEAAKEVLQFELKLDELEVEYRKNHIQRLHKNLCSVGTGSIYLDLLTNLERIGDHSKNIAQFVLHE
jgi:phosphate:Na+ symporter